MGYVYDFDIGSVLFFSLTIFFYLCRKRLRNLQDGIFTAMLIASMVAVVFDFAAAAMEYRAMAHPVWLLYAVNMLFIFGMQTCLPLFFLYAVASVGKFNRFSTGWRLLAAIPYIVTMALLFASPFVDFGICTIDAGHIYRHGPTHMMLYVNMGVYVLAGVAVLMKNGRNIRRAKRNVILLFVLVLFSAMVLQLAFPQYLLTASATALALTSLFYVLQSPVDQVNPFTGAFNRTLLPSLLQDYIERGRSYTLLLFSLRSIEELTRLYGGDAGDALLRAYSESLMRRFSDDVVAYMDTSDFVVVRLGLLSRAEAERLCAETPETIVVDGRAVALDVRVGAAPYAADPTARADVSIADYMLRQMHAMPRDEVLFADEAYKRACAATLQLEASLERLFSETGVQLALFPILDASGDVAAEEARLAVPGEMAQYVSDRQFLQAVGQSGYAGEYYRALLSALSDRRDRYGTEKRLCLVLLPAVLLREDASERILSLVSAQGFAPEQILFAVDEAEIASSLSVLRENIRRLAEHGFAFMVDTFAEGYTDMSLLISLPLRYARLHESLVAGAAGDAHAAALLKGLIGVLADVGIAAVCPGVDTASSRRAAIAAGAPLLQGPCAEGAARS